MPEVKLGILGMGTVGSAVVQILHKNSELLKQRTGFVFRIKRILVRDISKKRGYPVDRNLLTTNPDDILEDKDIDIILELMGGLNPAYDYIRRALASGKQVVTANKEVISKKGGELLELAGKSGVELLYEASVGGGIPLLRPLRQCLIANNIHSLIGIINGTTNYVLTKMTREGISLSSALKSAQELGYAEANPASDIDGLDAAYKLSILASLAFGEAVYPQDVLVDGIRTISAADIRYAAELGYEIKLLAIAKKKGEHIEARVHPALIPNTHPLAAVSHIYNAVFVRGEEVGELMFFGKGAGGLPTASAVVADVIHAAFSLDTRRTYPYNSYKRQASVVPRGDIESRYYIRLIGLDRPGVFAQVATALASEEVSMASIIQRNGIKPEDSEPLAEMVVVTYPVKQSSIDRAVARIEKLESIRKVASVIRVEKEL